MKNKTKILFKISIILNLLFSIIIVSEIQKRAQNVKEAMQIFDAGIYSDEEYQKFLCENKK